MNKKRVGYIINEVVKNFDFSKVKKVMKALNWTWKSSNDKVPSIPQLKKAAKETLWRTYEFAEKNNEEAIWTSSGGFTAKGYYSKNEDKLCLTLFFTIDDNEYTEWEQEVPYKYKEIDEKDFKLTDSSNDQFEFLEI